MNNFLLAAELNNLGVERLGHGDLRGALDLFRQSLSYTAGDLRSCSTSAEDDKYMSSSSTSSYSCASPASPGPCGGDKENNDASMTEIHATSSTRPPLNSQQEQQPQPGPAIVISTPFVHSKGINVIPFANAYSPDLLVNTAIVSSIQVFNLAIVCHLKGLEAGDSNGSNNTRLVKAKSLYERSQRLLVDAGVPCQQYSMGNPVTDMISMACLNNLAQIEYELGHYEACKQSFELLIRFASTIVPDQYGDSYVGTLMESTKSNFLLNAIILQKPSLAPAA